MKSHLLNLLSAFIALLTVALFPPSAPNEEATDKNPDLDAEIAQLEQKRVAELLLCLQLEIKKENYLDAAGLVSRVFVTPPATSDDIARLKELLQELALGLLHIAKAPEQTAEICSKATQTLGDDAILLYLASLAYEQMGLAEKQNEFRQRARASKKDDQPYWFGVGLFFDRNNELPLALEAFEAAAAIASDKPTFYSADSQASMASIYCRLGDYEKALERCDALQEIARKIIVSRAKMSVLIAAVYAEKAREEEIDEKYEQAIEDYKKSAEFSPQPEGTYNSIGELYFRAKNYEEAEKWFTRAVEGGLPMGHAGLGDIRKASGKLDEAEKKYAECEKAYLKEIEDEPDLASNYNNLAWFFVTHDRQLDKSVSLAQKALELAPDSPEYLDTLAELYYRTGKPEAAVREIKKAIALNPAHLKYYQKQLDKFHNRPPE